MTSELENFFGPRKLSKDKPVVTPTNARPWAAGLAAQGPAVTPQRRRDPNKPTPNQLKNIGEGLTKYILKKAGINLRKIEQIAGWGGYYKSVDVDFVDDARRVKVEAKTWWTKGGKNNFPLSRFSKKERQYLYRAGWNGWRAWVTIALLDGAPSRQACNTFYVILWPEWMRIEAELRRRASGNYEGKSLRVRDLDLLARYAIGRDGTRWAIPPGHWVTQ